MASGSNKVQHVAGAVIVSFVLACMCGIVFCFGLDASNQREDKDSPSSQQAPVSSSREELDGYFEQADPLIERAISLMNDSFVAYENGVSEKQHEDFEELLRLEQRTASGYIVSAPYDVSDCALQLSLCVQAASSASSHLGAALKTEPFSNNLLEFHIEQAERARAEAIEAYDAYVAASMPYRR